MSRLRKGIDRRWFAWALLFGLPILASGGELYVYRGSGKPDAKFAKFENSWEPFFFTPAPQAPMMSVQEEYPGEGLGLGKESKAIEFTWVITSADTFAQFYFQEKGVQLGTKKGIDVETLLNAKPGEKVYLKFHAMRKANTEAVVGFRSGGLAVKKARDSVIPAAMPKEKFIKLSADWADYSIDLTGEKLDQVVSPFSVVLQSNDHTLPKGGEKSRIVFYVTDIRYVTEAKAAK